MTTRYADGWEFDGRSEEYLRETFDLWAADTKDQTGAYRSGMRAIIEECHARAIEFDEKRSIVRACLSIPSDVELSATQIEQGFDAYMSGRADDPQAGTLTVHTAGELHPAPTTQRMTFTFNLSDLLDDPAHKPAAHLIDLDGTDSRVQDFVFATEGALDLYEDMMGLIARQLRRGKDIDVMVVCRGGKHRSVAFGESLADMFKAPVTHHHVHLPRVVSEPAEGQTWECRDQVGRGGEQVRVVKLIDDPDGEVAVEFIVTKASTGYEAELGSGGSMEATEFAQRYKLVR